MKWQRFALYICLTVSLCVFAGLLGSYFLYGEKAVDPITILLVDEDDSVESRLFYSIVTSMEDYKTLIVFEKADGAFAADAIAENRATVAVTIPEGFAESVKNGENRAFAVTYNAASPIKAALVKRFIGAFTAMLQASQIGVYAALDYTRETGDAAAYAEIFRGINLRYMNVVLNRSGLFDPETVSATGEAGLFVYYAFAAYLFVLFAGALLFIDVLQRVFRRETLVKLSRFGTGSLRIAGESLCAVFTVLVLINAVLLGLYCAAERLLGFSAGLDFTGQLLAYIPLILLAVSAFAVLTAALLPTVQPAGIFVSTLTLCFLILSGGIVPVQYFPEGLRFFSRFTPNYWAARLLTDGSAGRFVFENAAYVTLAAIGMAASAALLIKKRMRS
ncbi:MAG: ABC transporter permease [Clostridiales bacterium]|nr:ABC transporter permease [Clostridiales bacterium]